MGLFGMFIALDGLDGCGKSSVAASLADHLRSQGRSVEVREHPSDGFFGRRCKGMLLRRGSVALALSAGFLFTDMLGTARRVRRARREGTDVIAVRYHLSCLFLEGRCGATVHSAFRALMPRPDVDIMIDVEPETALERVSARGLSEEMFENLGSMVRTRDSMLSSDGISVISGNGTREETLALVLGLVEGRYPQP